MGESISDLLTRPSRADRLGDRIAADIKRLILSEKIGPGQKLPAERDLAALLGVSRVAVREALRLLEHSGLLEISGSTRGGAVVTDNLYKPMAGSMSDLYDKGQLTLGHFVELRRANECFLVRLAAERATEADLARLASLNEGILCNLESGEGFRESNMAFHVALAELSANPLGVLIVRSLLEILGLVRPYSVLSRDFREDTYRRHQVILEALANGDAEQCAEAVRIDVEQTYKVHESVTTKSRRQNSRKGGRG